MSTQTVSSATHTINSSTPLLNATASPVPKVPPTDSSSSPSQDGTNALLLGVIGIVAITALTLLFCLIFYVIEFLRKRKDANSPFALSRARPVRPGDTGWFLPLPKDPSTGQVSHRRRRFQLRRKDQVELPTRQTRALNNRLEGWEFQHFTLDEGQGQGARGAGALALEGNAASPTTPVHATPSELFLSPPPSTSAPDPNTHLKFLPDGDFTPFERAQVLEDEEAGRSGAGGDAFRVHNLGFGSVSVHCGTGLAFLKWSERSVVADIGSDADTSAAGELRWLYYEVLLSEIGVFVKRARRRATATVLSETEPHTPSAAAAPLDLDFDVETASQILPAEETPSRSSSAVEVEEITVPAPRPHILVELESGVLTPVPPPSPSIDARPTTAPRSVPSEFLPRTGDSAITIGVGFVSRPYPSFLLPGRYASSVAVISTGTAWFVSLFCGGTTHCTKLTGTPPRQGDTVGVGLGPGGFCVTVNGKSVRVCAESSEGPGGFLELPTKATAVGGAWYPCVGADGPCQMLAARGRLHVDESGRDVEYVEGTLWTGDYTAKDDSDAPSYSTGSPVALAGEGV